MDQFHYKISLNQFMLTAILVSTIFVMNLYEFGTKHKNFCMHFLKNDSIQKLIGGNTERTPINQLLNASKNSFSSDGNALNYNLPKPLYPSKDLSRQKVVQKNADFKSAPIKNDPDGKLVLFYTTTYGVPYVKNWTILNGTFYYPSEKIMNCPVRCKATLDKFLLNQSHAVVFDVLDSLYHTKRGESRIPDLTKRNDRQIWVASMVEAPGFHQVSKIYPRLDIFNWTMTYYSNSDIYFPYGFFYKSKEPKSLEGIPTINEIRNKKLVVSLMSNCDARSNRNHLIAKMQKYTKVDVYGNCGRACPTNVSNCRLYLGSIYKFFLAFENSMCQEYVTEKFFAAFDNNLVPIVYGLVYYSQIAPPNSYINVLDYKSIRSLVDYLLYLDANHLEYLKYFEWKKYYVNVGSGMIQYGFCNLCIKLWEMEFKHEKQWIKNFAKWWIFKRDVPAPLGIHENLKMAELLNETETVCLKNHHVISGIDD